jgi:DNA-binding SARP family transcriptional activator
MPAPRFHLQTLGRLALIDPSGAEDRSLGTRRLKLALLAYLAITKRPVTRDALVELFWGDQDEERARHSLSDALSHLRRALGAESIATRRAEIVLADDAPLVVDLVSLHTAAAAKRWSDVVALHHGPFLDAVHVQDSSRWDLWVTQQRSAAERLFETAARAECGRMAAANAWGACATLAQRWLEQSPMAQDAAAHLVDALARADADVAMGARRAIDAYAAWERRLAREFETKPDAAVTSRAAALAEIAAPPLPVTPPAPMLTPTSTPVVEPPAPRRRIAVSPKVVAAAIVAVGAVAILTFIPSRQDRARAIYHEALAAREGGDRATAIERAQAAIATDSSFAPAWRALGVYLSDDETARAQVRDALTRAYELREEVAGLEQLQVVAAYHLDVTSDFAAAASAQRAILREDPQNARAWHDLGRIYQRLGDNTRAADAYQRANGLVNTHAGRWINLVDVLYAIGDTSGARAQVDSMALALPGHPTVFRLTADIRSAGGDYAGAERALRAFLDASQANTRGVRIGQTLLSRALWSSGRLDEGDRAQREAVTIARARREYADALLGGVALAQVSVWRRQDRRRALAQLNEALRVTPLDSIPLQQRPYLAVAAAYAFAGDAAEASALIARYEREIPTEIQRQDREALEYARGALALATANGELATEHFERVPSPDCAVCGLPELGLAHERRGDAAAARAAYEEFLATPTLRRTDLVDALHRQWVSARLRGAR